jgi:osmotically-inducible protein OsmY
MPKALPGIVGTLLALAATVPAPLASAQILARFRGQQTPVQKSRYEANAFLSEEQQRLAEMKVELALLSDIATFPYDLRAYANGNTLELRGAVPNETIRQRAMELARRNTFLRGIDGLKIQPSLSVRSPLRPSRLLQQEGAELLHKSLGEAAKQMSLEVRPNGTIVLTGRIDSVESKLEISRLFRRLSGCTAVLNELAVEPILRDGQRLVRLTRNGLLLAPPSVLALDLGPSAASGQQWTALPSRTPTANSLAAQEDDLRLPTALASKQASKPSKLASEKVGSGWEAFAPSKLPIKWGHPTKSWETQVKDLESAYTASEPATKQTAHQQTPTPAQPLPKPADLTWGPPPASAQVKLSPLNPVLSRPAQTVWTRCFPAEREASGQYQPANTPHQPAGAMYPPADTGRSPSRVTETKTAAEPVMTWRRPGDHEESEPKIAPATTQPRASVSSPENSPRSNAPSLRSPRRWPPAYVTGPSPGQGRSGVTGPSPGQGRPGVIVFEDDPPPSKPASAVIAATRPLVPAELQRQIQSLCGRQARDVVVAAQHDGSVLVRVKVANHAIEDQLSRKILALPEMQSWQVRLLIEIEP